MVKSALTIQDKVYKMTTHKVSTSHQPSLYGTDHTHNHSSSTWTNRLESHHSCHLYNATTNIEDEPFPSAVSCLQLNMDDPNETSYITFCGDFSASIKPALSPLESTQINPRTRWILRTDSSLESVISQIEYVVTDGLSETLTIGIDTAAPGGGSILVHLSKLIANAIYGVINKEKNLFKTMPLSHADSLNQSQINLDENIFFGEAKHFDLMRKQDFINFINCLMLGSISASGIDGTEIAEADGKTKSEITSAMIRKAVVIGLGVVTAISTSGMSLLATSV